MINKSIVFENPEFKDRFAYQSKNCVDVIIPVFNTNMLWRQNLLSIYREIPVNSLLIGNGGCTDNTLEILNDFPRVTVVDQSAYHTLGFCIKDLIERVSTAQFVYLHSDVYLPAGWFDAMLSARDRYDWFECHRKALVLVEYDLKSQNEQRRTYSGSQFGSTQLLKKAVESIDDDYLYRNEDIVISELVKSLGGKVGRIAETYHYHQICNKNDNKGPVIESVSIKHVENEEYLRDTLLKQLFGLVKYTSPKNDEIANIIHSVAKRILAQDILNYKQLIQEVSKLNSEWGGKLKTLLKKSNLAKTKRPLVERILRKILRYYEKKC
ncbi:glycosyltransferase family 2 protein [Candidatus Sumerlaeota bacterium]|nr:glycosyltransferase family 2 protein [Candidatus Sumerlaeota bacterium]